MLLKLNFKESKTNKQSKKKALQRYDQKPNIKETTKKQEISTHSKLRK
jgi:hypothetical protein